MTEVQCHWKKHILNLSFVFPFIHTWVPLKALLKLSFSIWYQNYKKKCRLILGLLSILIDIEIRHPEGENINTYLHKALRLNGVV